MYWTRNSTTDYDDDGCNDASEDFNDDNDNYQDYEDIVHVLLVPQITPANLAV